MSTVSAPFGLRPAYHPSGQTRPERFAITAASAAAMYKNGGIIINTDGGVITAADNTGYLDGVFVGCEYLDVTLKPVFSNFWPADTLATEAFAFVITDKDTVFEIQCNGSLAQTDINSHIGMTTATLGSTMTGQSTGYATLANLSTSTENQLQIIGLAPYADNAWGDTFTIVRVKLANSKYAAPLTAN